MRINFKLILRSIAQPLLVGLVSSLFTRNAMDSFQTMQKPLLSPPGWLFPIVWTILYLLMGISAYLFENTDADEEAKANDLMLYRYQLIVNFLWPVFFFSFGWYLFSLLWLILLWLLVFFMIRRFAEISKLAAYLNIPYLIWLTFAAYLNAGVWWLNR